MFWKRIEILAPKERDLLFFKKRSPVRKKRSFGQQERSFAEKIFSSKEGSYCRRSFKEVLPKENFA
jgi:hypothetical protein